MPNPCALEGRVAEHGQPLNQYQDWTLGPYCGSRGNFFADVMLRHNLDEPGITASLMWRG
jgi:hypothetical protein